MSPSTPFSITDFIHDTHTSHTPTGSRTNENSSVFAEHCLGGGIFFSVPLKCYPSYTMKSTFDDLFR